MAFGMGGMGSTRPETDAGAMRGTLKEVACQCWFTSTGRMMPLMLKLKDGEDRILKVDQITVHSQERKNYAGIPSVEFDCTLASDGKKQDVKLVYFMAEGRWGIRMTG